MARKTRKKATPRRKKAARPARRRANPKGTLIGARALSITYRGGDGKKGGTEWEHVFDTPVQVIGCSDGSVKLVSTTGKRLWKDYRFDGPKEEWER